MPLPALGPLLLSTLLAFAFQLLLALGIGFVSYTVALPSIYGFISSYFSELPIEVLSILGILRVDIAITMILSAAAAKLTYSMSSVALSKIPRS